MTNNELKVSVKSKKKLSCTYKGSFRHFHKTFDLTSEHKINHTEIYINNKRISNFFLNAEEKWDFDIVEMPKGWSYEESNSENSKILEIYLGKNTLSREDIEIQKVPRHKL